jgi:hypothetical protein
MAMSALPPRHASVDPTPTDPLAWLPGPVRPAPWMLHSRRLPDGPLRWAIVQPNARGSHEFRSARALGERQLLKGVNQYLAERALLVVGSDTVAIWPILARRIVGACLGRWRIDRLLAVPVAPAAPTATWPAAVIVDLDRGRLLTEVRGVHDDAETRAVFAALSAD